MIAGSPEWIYIIIVGWMDCKFSLKRTLSRIKNLSLLTGWGQTNTSHGLYTRVQYLLVLMSLKSTDFLHSAWNIWIFLALLRYTYLAIANIHNNSALAQESQILELGLPCSSLLAIQTSRETPPFPLNLSSTQVQEVCQKQPNTKHSQHRGRESKLWEGTGLTSERATCKKFLPNYWECTGFLYKNVPVHIHVLKLVSLFCLFGVVLVLCGSIH